MIRAGVTALVKAVPYRAGISQPDISQSGITPAARAMPARGISRRAAAVARSLPSLEYCG